MAKVIVQTRTGPLTDNDFEGDAPPPGSSDKRYSKKTLKSLNELADLAKEWQYSDTTE